MKVQSVAQRKKGQLLGIWFEGWNLSEQYSSKEFKYFLVSLFSLPFTVSIQCRQPSGLLPVKVESVARGSRRQLRGIWFEGWNPSGQNLSKEFKLDGLQGTIPYTGLICICTDNIPAGSCFRRISTLTWCAKPSKYFDKMGTFAFPIKASF